MKKKVLLIVSIIIIIALVVVACVVISNNKNNNEGQNQTQNGESTPKNNSIVDNSTKALSDQEKSIFNSSFDMYLGKNIKGNRVKNLISTIKYSNEHSTIGKIDIILNGEEATDSSKIDTSKTYSISFKYDNNKLINKAIIEEN